MSKVKSAVLYADSNRGQFIPQFFAMSYDPAMWKPLDKMDVDNLICGPDCPEYWDSWQSILGIAETSDGGVLYQDDDLWVIYPDSAIEAINQLCNSQLEYEESHVDAGNNYSHMPAESWTRQSTKEFAAQCAKEIEHYIVGEGWKVQFSPVDFKGLDSDTVAEIALDNFEMVSGNIYTVSVPENLIILDSFPVGEIEVQLDLEAMGIDGLTWKYIKDLSRFDAYIRESGNSVLAYMTTDSVWYAAIEREKLQELIDNHVKGD